MNTLTRVRISMPVLLMMVAAPIASLAQKSTRELTGMLGRKQIVMHLEEERFADSIRYTGSYRIAGERGSIGLYGLFLIFPDDSVAAVAPNGILHVEIEERRSERTKGSRKRGRPVGTLVGDLQCRGLFAGYWNSGSDDVDDEPFILAEKGVGFEPEAERASIAAFWKQWQGVLEGRVSEKIADLVHFPFRHIPEADDLSDTVWSRPDFLKHCTGIFDTTVRRIIRTTSASELFPGIATAETAKELGVPPGTLYYGMLRSYPNADGNDEFDFAKVDGRYMLVAIRIDAI